LNAVEDRPIVPAAKMDNESEDRFASAVASMEARESERNAGRAMWHAHHWPDEYDRCTMIGGRPVCRRCLTFYPLAVLVAIVSLLGPAPWPETYDLWFIWGLCAPATIDFVGEQLMVFRYSVRRQVVATTLMAPAFGQGLAHELDDSWSLEFWGPVLAFCTIWFVAALAGRKLRNR
jgi:hypothetical protein